MGEIQGDLFDFEWDDKKATANIRNHSVSFQEAASIFDDGFMVTDMDLVHSDEEDRYVSIGLSSSRRLLVVFYTERVRTIRIISAREPTPREKQDYENDSF